eukprot:403345014
MEPYCYNWLCPFCFKPERLTHSTPMLGLNIMKFDVAVELWAQNCNSRQAHILMSDSAMADFFIIIRKACSRFIENRVKKYLVFQDQIDIDETLIGQQRWSYMGHFPQLRWVFGMLCRRSRIPVMYFIKDKSHQNLVSIIKKHTVPGTIIFSDSHSSYVNMPKSSSKLTQYGFYHYWICHITRYVHEKFGFVHTSGIELQWNNMKKSLKGLRYASTEKIINEYVNNHTFRTLYKKTGLHDMVLKAMRDFFDYSYNEILSLCQYEEYTCPNLWKIDDYMKHLQNVQIEDHLNAMQKVKLTRKEQQYWQMQEDLYDCVVPRDPTVDVHEDVHRYLEIESCRGKKLSNHIKHQYIPISHVLEYREFWEDCDLSQIGKEVNPEEYPQGLEISSINYIKGERDYLKELREKRETLVIDLVKEYNEKEQDPNSIRLTFSEKFMAGKQIKNKNQFLINKSKPYDMGKNF